MSETAPRLAYRCARGARCFNSVPRPTECPCQCHGQGALSAMCDIEGGCGHLHDDDTSDLVGCAILTETGLCEDCISKIERALEDLPTSYVELAQLLSTGSSGIVSDVIVCTREHPIPIRLSVESLMAAMVHECETWAEAVAERLGVTWNTSTELAGIRRGKQLQRASRLLANATDTLIALPELEYRPDRHSEWITRDGIDAAIELHRLHGLVRFACGKTKLVHRLPAPCPRCERLTLIRKNGSDLVECELCPRKERAWWSVDEYKRLTLVLADSWQDEVPERTPGELVSLAEGTVRGTVHDILWTDLPRIGFPESEAVA